MIPQSIRESFRNLWASKQRSLLALLGMIIGTGSVIAMSNIGAIAEKHALEQFISTGVDQISINLSLNRDDGRDLLTPKEIDKLLTDMPGVAFATPMVASGQPVRFGKTQEFSMIIASRPELFQLQKLSLSSGRTLSPYDSQERYCVIGDSLASGKNGAVPLEPGSQLHIGNEVFTVIGVLNKTTRSPLMAFDPNISVFVSLDNAARISRQAQVNILLGKLLPDTSLDGIDATLKAHLSHLLPGVNVEVRTAGQMIEQMSEQMRTYSLLLGVIGSISLIVGGVGIMNIMLVSVTERRMEIGIRMAIGARRRDIKRMFLIETLTLSLLGGVFGTLLGVGSSAIFAQVLEWGFIVDSYAIPLGIGVSTIVGIFFGLYPAVIAARMQPVEALRGD